MVSKIQPSSKRASRHPWLIVALLLVSGCSSTIPEQIRQTPQNAPRLAEVRAEPERFHNSQVRWGGIILETENKNDSSWIKVIALPLRGNGKPRNANNSQGRFIAVVDQFLEPLLYSQDRKITFSGHVVGSHTDKVGDFSYQYPLIKVDMHHLWPKDPPPADDYYPYYPYYWRYDPWYHPIYYPRHPVKLVPHYPRLKKP